MEESGFTTFESCSLYGRRFVMNILRYNRFDSKFRFDSSIVSASFILYMNIFLSNNDQVPYKHQLFVINS